MAPLQDAAWKERCARVAQQSRRRKVVTEGRTLWTPKYPRDGNQICSLPEAVPALPRTFSKTSLQMADASKSQQVEHRLRRHLLVRVTLPLVAAGMLLLAIAGYSSWRVYRLHSRAVDILNVNVANIRAADEVVTETQRVRYLVRQGAATYETMFATKATELLVELEQLTRKLSHLANSDDERQLADRVERGRRESIVALNRLEPDRMYSTVAAKLDSVAEELIPARILAPANAFIALNEEQILRSSAYVERISGQLITGLLLLGVTGAIAGVITGYVIARTIGQRLLKLSLPLRDVAGQLDQAGGEIMVSMDPQVDDLEGVLQRVADRVSEVVKQLQQSQRDTLRAEQLAALGQLAAGLSHELRNPLMAIISILGDSDHAGDLDDRDIAVLREEALRLEGLVQSLLDYARPNTPHMRVVDLRDVLVGVVGSVSARATQRGVDLVIDRSLSSVAAVADQCHVRQIVMNFLLNAIDATPRDGTIEVGARMCGETVEVTISDEGDGIPSDLGEMIFEPFVSKKETGIGLGLSVSRRLAELNGGILSASSSERGAIFTLNLPSNAIAIVSARETVEA